MRSDNLERHVQSCSKMPIDTRRIRQPPIQSLPKEIPVFNGADFCDEGKKSSKTMAMLNKLINEEPSTQHYCSTREKLLDSDDSMDEGSSSEEELMLPMIKPLKNPPSLKLGSGDLPFITKSQSSEDDVSTESEENTDEETDHVEQIKELKENLKKTFLECKAGDKNCNKIFITLNELLR